jgi:hypothetical protein
LLDLIVTRFHYERQEQAIAGLPKLVSLDTMVNRFRSRSLGLKTSAIFPDCQSEIYEPVL